MYKSCVFFVCTIILGVVLSCTATCSSAQSRVLDEHTFHLRRGSVPEWATFSKEAAGHLALNFDAKANTTHYTLSLRQEDVKQTWRLLLNGQELGGLYKDENSMISYWDIAPRMLHTGNNTLRIEQADTLIDDIQISEIKLYPIPIQELLSQAKVHITVADKQTGKLLPARLTITAPGNVLQPVGASSNATLVSGQVLCILPLARHPLAFRQELIPFMPDVALNMGWIL